MCKPFAVWLLLFTVAVLPACDKKKEEYKKSLEAATERISALKTTNEELRAENERIKGDCDEVMKDVKQEFKEREARLRELHREEKAEIEKKNASLLL